MKPDPKPLSLDEVAKLAYSRGRIAALQEALEVVQRSERQSVAIDALTELLEAEEAKGNV
jgi:hypothetical protein